MRSQHSKVSLEQSRIAVEMYKINIIVNYLCVKPKIEFIIKVLPQAL